MLQPIFSVQDLKPAEQLLLSMVKKMQQLGTQAHLTKLTFTLKI